MWNFGQWIFMYLCIYLVRMLLLLLILPAGMQLRWWWVQGRQAVVPSQSYLIAL